MHRTHKLGNGGKTQGPLTMPRPQFSIRTLLCLTLVVAAFLGGMLCDRAIAGRKGYFYRVIDEASP